MGGAVLCSTLALLDERHLTRMCQVLRGEGSIIHYGIDACGEGVEGALGIHRAKRSLVALDVSAASNCGGPQHLPDLPRSKLITQKTAALPQKSAAIQILSSPTNAANSRSA
jgi:hypothetical protein